MENTSGILQFFLKPFAIGLYIGLAFSLFIFVRGKIGQGKLRREITALKQHLHIKLDIESEENERKKRDTEKLRKENENLRVTLQSYMTKPGRRELRQLNLYHKAVEILTEKAPGFAQSWQSALRDGEEEIRQAERGLIPLVSRLLPGSLKGSRRSGRSPGQSGGDR